MTTDHPGPDTFLTAAIDRFGSPLTGDQYVEHVLVARQSAWITEHQAANAAKGVERGRIWAPLLPDFVLDVDTDHVALSERAPRPPRRRRRYRPASFWRARVDRLDKQMQALSTPILNDRAAAGGGGLGPRRTRAVQAGEDARLERYTRLRRRHDRAHQMLTAAEAREACQTDRR
ncbi:hypothetical protein [Prescottella equi]